MAEKKLQDIEAQLAVQIGDDDTKDKDQQDKPDIDLWKDDIQLSHEILRDQYQDMKTSYNAPFGPLHYIFPCFWYHIHRRIMHDLFVHCLSLSCLSVVLKDAEMNTTNEWVCVRSPHIKIVTSLRQN